MGFLDRLFKKEYNPNDRLSDRCEAVKKLNIVNIVNFIL